MARRKQALVALAVLVVAGAGLLFWRPWIPRVEVGGVRINPYVEIDPGRNYRIVVWDYEIPLPWSKTTHREALAAAVTEYQKANPNITVDLVVRNWDEGDGPLRDALELGTPPDVLGMPNGIHLIDTDYQVPLEHYLSDTDSADLFTTASNTASDGRHLWAFPRWINPARWVVRLDRWPNSRNTITAGKELPSLTVAQWEEAMAEARTKMGKGGLALNALDPAFFRDLMISATGKTFLGPDGKVQWTEESIRNVAVTLRSWVQRGFIAADLPSLARTRLAQFWGGNVMALAPTNTWLLHHILQRSGALASPEGDPASPVSSGTSVARLESVQRTAAWLAPPQLKQTLAVSATVSGYAVLRQAQYKGHDHTKVAANVANYLSRRMGVWEAARIFAVPAHPSAVPEWLATSRLPEPDLHALLTWSAHAVTAPIDDRLARLENRILTETAVPNLIQVMQGKLTPEQFAQDLVSSPVSASTEVAVP